MYLLDILNNMNNKKCLIPTHYIEKLHFADFHTHTIFPSLSNIRTFKLMNLQNKLNDLTENDCLKNFTGEFGRIFTFSSFWVSISRKILFSKLHKLRSIKSP